MFRPSIYYIEEGDQILPYWNRVIFVFVCVVLWPHGLAMHYNASGLSRLVEIHRIQGQKKTVVYSRRYGMTGVYMWQIWLMNSPWFKILHTEGTYYFYSGHEERGTIPNLQLFSCVEHQAIHRQRLLDQLLKTIVIVFSTNMSFCRYIDRQMVDISIWQLTSICHPYFAAHLVIWTKC